MLFCKQRSAEFFLGREMETETTGLGLGDLLRKKFLLMEPPPSYVVRHYELSHFLGKGNEMAERVNVEPLVLLADTSARQVYQDLGVAMEGTDFAAELKELQDEDNKERRKNAAKEVLKLFKAKQEAIQREVRNIRDYRRQEATAKARLEQLNRAEAYGKETSNFLPLALLTGSLGLGLVREVPGNLLEVPKDWEPKPEASKPAGTP